MANFDGDLKTDLLFKEGFAIFARLAAPFLATFLIYFMADLFLQRLLGIDPLDLFNSSAHTGWYVGCLFVISTIFSGVISASTWSYINGAAHPVKNGVRRVIEIFPLLLLASFLAGMATVFGLLLLILPGIIVALALAVVVPVMVVENPGPLAALQRSYELTNGHKVQIFFIMLIFIVAILLFGLIGGVLVEVLGIGASGAAFMDMVVQGLFGIYSPIVMVLIYGTLAGTLPTKDVAQDEPID